MYINKDIFDTTVIVKHTDSHNYVRTHFYKKNVLIFDVKLS